MRVLWDTTHVARKAYRCDACDIWCRSGFGERDVSADDWLVAQGCEADRWKIRRGQRYRRVVYVDGRRLVNYRGRLDMDDLCERHNLFGD